MTKMTKKLLRLAIPQLACAALLVAAGTTTDQEKVLEIDPAATQVEFTLADVLHTVHGKFVLKRGNLRFDPSTGKASGELVVNAASGDSGSNARDRRMRGNILETDKFPDIVFRPDRVTGTVIEEGVSQVQLHGVFSIHGADHEIVLPVSVEAANGQYTATTRFEVPYVKWGMKNPSNLFLRVSDKVQISIRTVAHTHKAAVSQLQ